MQACENFNPILRWAHRPCLPDKAVDLCRRFHCFPRYRIQPPTENPSSGGPVLGTPPKGGGRKANWPPSLNQAGGPERHALSVRRVRPRRFKMDWKQIMRSKMACGFSCRRDDSGRVEGHGVLKLPKRNSYELIGLRRPLRREGLRLRPLA